MSNLNEKLQQLRIKVEALKDKMDADTLFDSSLYFAVLEFITTATLTQQKLFETLTDYAGGFIAKFEALLSRSKPRPKINSKLCTVFQP